MNSQCFPSINRPNYCIFVQILFDFKKFLSDMHSFKQIADIFGKSEYYVKKNSLNNKSLL